MSCIAIPPQQQLFQTSVQICYMSNEELLSYLYNNVYRGSVAQNILRSWLFGRCYKHEDMTHLVLLLLPNHSVTQIMEILMRFNIETQFVTDRVLINSYYRKKGIPPPNCNTILVWYIGDDSYSAIVN